MTRALLLIISILWLISGQVGFSKDLASILYTAWGTLCSTAPGGGKPQCTKTGNEVDSPSWQPGSARIVAEAGPHDGPHSLVLFDGEGRLIRRVDDSSDFIRPAWSPDGRAIFALNYQLGSAVARWDADGKNKRVISVTGESERGRAFQMISFSPSGTRAALLTMKFQEMVLANVTANGFTAFATLPRGFSYVSQSAWRDEDHILFVGKRDSQLADLWELSVPTGAVTKRGIEGLSLRDQLAISPDRQSVVVTAVANADSKNIRWSLWQYSLSTQRTIRLTNGTEDIVGSWR